MTLAIAPQILLSLTLLVSGISKLRTRRETVDAMTSLRIPVRSLHPAAAAILPPAEIILAMVAFVPIRGVQVAAAVLALALMVAYLVIIARALRFPDPVSCSCFGTLSSPTISRATLWRNIILTVLAVLALVTAISGASAVAITAAPLAVLGWVLAIAVTAVLTVLVLGGIAPASAVPAPPQTTGGTSTAAPQPDDDPSSDDDLEYVRSPIPSGVLHLDGGRLVSLRQLTASQAVLLLWLNEGCGPCVRVLDQLPTWVDRLEGAVAVHPLFYRDPAELSGTTREQARGNAAEDMAGHLAEAFGAHGTPAAVLLGADGLLAGGPVMGGGTVEEFVEEIIGQIEEARSDGQLEVPTA